MLVAWGVGGIGVLLQSFRFAPKLKVRMGHLV